MANPLTDALSFKKAIGAPTKGLYPSRTQHNSASTQEGGHGMLSFHKSKIPNLGNAKQGDKVTMNVQGSIHSIDPNGNMKMHVSDLKPDTQGTESKQYPDQKTPDRGVDRNPKAK